MTPFTTHCVSLGPGDPELLTLRALRVLRSCDVIYCPGTTGTSRAKAILTYHGIPEEKIETFVVPMKVDRTEALSRYAAVAQAIHKRLEEGTTVAFVAEGDGGFYSSQHYIAEILEEDPLVQVEYVPGIPAFIAAGATAGLHVTKGDDALVVLPLANSPDEITRELKEGRTVVLMKPSRHEAVIKEAMRGIDRLEVSYLENVGVKGKEFISHEVSEILARRFPYFSILILRQKHQD